MTLMDSDIKDFEDKICVMRARVSGSSIYSRFGGISFYDSMNTQKLDDNKLILGHTYLHKAYRDNNRSFPRKKVIQLHKGFKKELSKRNLPHLAYDKMDLVKNKDKI